MSETKVYFGVTDFGDNPLIITQMIGIQPTLSWVKGETYTILQGQKTVRRTQSFWQLDSGLPPSCPFEEQIKALLSLLEPHKEAIHQVVRQFKGEIASAHYFKEANPGFNLGAETIRRVANLGLAIDFDIYCLDENEEN